MDPMHPAPQIPTARHVLVVDDDDELREQICRYLGDHGFAAHGAADGRQMEQALAESPVDLVILDLMLPGEDGLSICRRLSAGGGPAISSRGLADFGR